MNDNNQNEKIKEAKKVFLDKGTCSHTYFYLLNRKFGHLKEAEELAADCLAGGILRQGYQCGMLWGATLAVGAEAFRRNDNKNQATASAISATQSVVESFLKRTNTVECSDITQSDMTSTLGLAKYLISGKPKACLNLAGDWAEEASQAAEAGLMKKPADQETPALSCASETLKKMGASEEEAAMVAGFAGGLGLSGNGCGALAAAIWLKTLRIYQEKKKKPGMTNPEAEKILKIFQKETGYELECRIITGRSFKTPDEHTKFIKEGGCSTLMDVISGGKS